MNVTCPHCNFSRATDPAKVPNRPVKVNCPKCGQIFSFDKSKISPDIFQAVDQQAAPEKVSCPACGLMQDKSDSCQGCGVIYARFQARQKERGPAAPSAVTLAATQGGNHNSAVELFPQNQQKAGFWIRVVSYLLDSFLLGMVQFVLSFLIGIIIGAMGIATENAPATNIVIWLFGITLSFGYAVFFTGYCGQTPAKMALRIKVIRTDGSPLSYGRAALREILGKFVSAILLGIGYLMVAFDNNKQGLHDKIADTYVIKL